MFFLELAASCWSVLAFFGVGHLLWEKPGKSTGYGRARSNHFCLLGVGDLPFLAFVKGNPSPFLELGTPFLNFGTPPFGTKLVCACLQNCAFFWVPLLALIVKNTFFGTPFGVGVFLGVAFFCGLRGNPKETLGNPRPTPKQTPRTIGPTAAPSKRQLEAREPRAVEELHGVGELRACRWLEKRSGGGESVDPPPREIQRGLNKSLEKESKGGNTFEIHDKPFSRSKSRAKWVWLFWNRTRE